VGPIASSLLHPNNRKKKNKYTGVGKERWPFSSSPALGGKSVSPDSSFHPPQKVIFVIFA